MLLLLLSVFTYVSADADAQIPISVPGYPRPALDTPIVTPALKSPVVTPNDHTPIVTPALGAPPIVLPAGQDGVALRSQFLQPALGGRVYYTSNPHIPNTVYYTPNTNFKKTPEDLTKLIKAYTNLSPDTKNSSQKEASARTGRSRRSWSSSKTTCRLAASRHSCKRSSMRTDVIITSTPSLQKQTKTRG